MERNLKAQASSKYRVLSVKELNSIEEKNRSNIIKSYIIDYNKAFVTMFKDGSSIILPPILGGKEGLFFYDSQDMDNMIKSQIFPVKGTGSFWEKEKKRVLSFSCQISYYCLKLSDILDYKVVISQDSSYLRELSDIINKKLKLKKDKNLYFYLAIYVGELLRQKLNAKWKLFPEYSLNMSYHPEIVYNNKFCDHWGFVIDQLKMADFLPVDIEDLVERSNQFFPINDRRYIEVKQEKL